MWVWFIGDGKDAEELPKTASGKVMKHVLRQWSAKLAEGGGGKVRISAEMPNERGSGQSGQM